MLEFRLLGPVEVLDEGRPLPSLPPKQRALLVALLLRFGEVVSKERLIDDLWGEEPPATAVPSLENAVSGVRKALGRDLVLTRPPGYAVAVDPEQVDVLRFHRLVARARAAAPEERAAKLKEALALFRGRPLPDDDLGPFAEAEAGRLEELQLAMHEDLLAAELELGRDAGLVTELERLVSEHPYRERLRAHLMLALYRAGRQADALAAYQAARRTLVDELGTEPDEELRELQRAILRQDPGLRPPRPRDRPEGRPQRKLVTVVACSLGDWATAAARLDAERMHAVLERYATTARSVVTQHGGAIDAVAGDAITAVFGVPAVREDDAVTALRAADALQAEVASLADGLGLAPRIGVDSGEVLVDPGGRALVTGVVVGQAQALARAAGPGEILVAESTHWLAKDAVTFDSVQRDGLGPHAALCYRLVDLAPDRGGGSLRLDSAFVGREHELRALEAALERAIMRRSCELCTVVGVAGVGKSRLVREFLDAVRDRATVVLARCVRRGEGADAWPVVETAPGIETTFLVALGLEQRSQPTQATFRNVRAALESRAHERPLVVAFDDLQWAEATLLDLVESILDASRAAPILIVCAARPELLTERAAWVEGASRATSLALGPLDHEESARLVDNLLGESDLPDPVIAHIVRSAGGYPLFVEELLATLVDQAVLRRVGGRWTTGELPALRIPPTVQALIAARLDRLPEAERLVLELGSVQGTRFEEAAVAALAPDDLEIRVQLARLVEKDLIRADRAPGVGFSFRHELVRDAAYNSIPKRARAELHERLADWLEEREVEPSPAVRETAGFHLERAQLLRRELGAEDPELAGRASARLGSAGRHASARGDPSAAARFYARAVTLLPVEAPGRTELIGELTRVVEELEALDDPRASAHARRLLDAARGGQLGDRGH